MEDGAIGFVVGLAIGIVFASMFFPAAIEFGERDALNYVHPCEKGILTTVKIGNENWVCANEKWIKQ